MDYPTPVNSSCRSTQLSLTADLACIYTGMLTQQRLKSYAAGCNGCLFYIHKGELWQVWLIYEVLVHLYGNRSANTNCLHTSCFLDAELLGYLCYRSLNLHLSVREARSIHVGGPRLGASDGWELTTFRSSLGISTALHRIVSIETKYYDSSKHFESQWQLSKGRKARHKDVDAKESSLLPRMMGPVRPLHLHRWVLV